MPGFPTFTQQTDLTDFAGAADINPVYDAIEDIVTATAFAGYSNTETLAATKTLVDSDFPIQYLDPDGANRDVELPAEGNSNHAFFFANTASAAFNLVIKDDSPATIITIGEGQIGFVFSDGTTWKGSVWTSLSASLTVQGIIEIATAAEVDTGTDATRAVSPDGLQGSNRNIRYLIFSLIDPDTDVAVDTDIGGDFTIPFAGTILQDDTLHDQLAATNDAAGVTGTQIVDIHLNGTTIMITNKLDTETGNKGTQDAATQPDLTTTVIVAGDILTFDVDAIHTTPGKGLKILMAIRED